MSHIKTVYQIKIICHTLKLFINVLALSHISLVIKLDPTESIADKRYIGIASHVEINGYNKDEKSLDSYNLTEIYNLTALSCKLSIAEEHELLLGGRLFDMSEKEGHQESCLVISDSNTATPRIYELCNANIHGFPIKHVVLPCQEKARTVEITYRGPNTTWFFLPILGNNG